MKTFATILTFIIIVDIFGFLLWTLSGQTPHDNFFIGVLSSYIKDILQ